MNIATLDGLFAAAHLAQHIRSRAPGQRDGQSHINIMPGSLPRANPRLQRDSRNHCRASGCFNHPWTAVRRQFPGAGSG
jgi:hypothetical protein